MASYCDAWGMFGTWSGTKTLGNTRPAADYGQMAELVAVSVHADVDHVTPLVGAHRSDCLREFHAGTVAGNRLILHG